MPETKIKICGLTRPVDARLCHSLGADFLGVVFAPSPRQVSPDRAREIRAAVPQARLVGVFADAPLATLFAAAGACRLDLIQLHGSEPVDYCEAVRSQLQLPIIRSLVADFASERDDPDPCPGADFLLVDLPKETHGPSDAMEHARRKAARARRRGQRVFLAGRLDPTNVRSAIAAIRPYGVDVARGVEQAPGIKDPAAVAQFIQEVRR